MAHVLDDYRRRAQTQSATTPVGSTRLLPHNLEAEESLLGAMLLSREAIATAAEVCTSEDFYKPAHGHIFDAILSLYAHAAPADPVTVAEELRRAGVLEMVGGSAALVGLQAGTPTTSNAAQYARIIEEHSLLRKLITVAGDIAEIGYAVPEDVTSAVDRAEAMVFEVAERRTSDTMAPLRDLLGQNLDRLEMLYERGESITGVPTGYLDLDEQLNGLQPNALYIIGARPAMGKSAFALGMAAHAAVDKGRPVLFFSLEMSHLELTQRLLCADAKVDSLRMRNGKLHAEDWPKITNAVARLADAPMYIDDNPRLTIMEIRGKARRLKAKLGDLGLIVIDYLQLMTGRTSAENRQVEVAEISRGLKILARELEVPVVALSQLSRNLEQRADKRPMLSDLRESGCMPASTKLRRADNGEEISFGELVLTQEQPLVWSLDERGRMVPARLTKAFPSGIKECFRLRLASGRSVEASANHPFLTDEGWMRLDELAVDGFVATPRVLPAPLAASADWTNDELALLAHLIGNGSIGPSFTYATADPASRDLVIGLARSVFGIEATSTKEGNTFQVGFPTPYRLTHGVRHPMSNWTEPLGLFGSRSWNRSVPPSILGCSEEQIAHFLQHLWATDGSISIRRNGEGDVVRVHYATTSERLALDVQQLLLRLGIGSSIASATKKHAGGEYRPGYCVRVQGTVDQTRFLTAIGCFGQQGSIVDEALAVAARQTPNPNDVATSDVFWDRITSIEATGAQPTFDATVEGTHNFIADGIVAHNSLEQDADVVMFLYRDEVYEPESPDRGTAEVIVAKHRSGPVGSTRLAFLDHYTKFANMARQA